MVDDSQVDEEDKYSAVVRQPQLPAGVVAKASWRCVRGHTRTYCTWHAHAHEMMMMLLLLLLLLILASFERTSCASAVVQDLHSLHPHHMHYTSLPHMSHGFFLATGTWQAVQQRPPASPLQLPIHERKPTVCVLHWPILRGQARARRPMGLQRCVAPHVCECLVMTLQCLSAL